MGNDKSFNVGRPMALKKYKNMEFFSRFKDPQKYDCNDISIKIRLTNRCNYDCIYCPYKNKTEKFNEWNRLQKILDFIKFLNKDYYYIYLHGGEPTLHPNFVEFNEELCKILDGKDYFVYFDTNFSMPWIFYKELMKKIDTSKYKINCTLHYGKRVAEFITKYIRLEDFVETQFNIMFQYQYFKEQNKFYEGIKNLISNVVPKPVFFMGNENNYSFEQRRFFYKSDPRRFYWKVDNSFIIHSLNEIELNQWTDFSFLKCDYGEKNIVIDVNGDLYFCTAHQLQRSDIAIGPQMNIFRDPFEKYNTMRKPKYCLFYDCSACDLRIKKEGKHDNFKQ